MKIVMMMVVTMVRGNDQTLSRRPKEHGLSRTNDRGGREGKGRKMGR